MDTQTTLGIARAALYPIISPNDPNHPIVASTINLAAQRLLNSGIYQGSLAKVVFKTGNDKLRDYITLPSYLISIVGLLKERVPQVVWGEFHAFSETGPGRLEDAENADGTPSDKTGWWWTNEDARDGHATQFDIPADVAGVLRFEIENPGDAGKIVHVGGTDINGRPVYGPTGVLGVDLTLAYPFALTTTQFRSVNFVQKPKTLGYVKLHVMNGISPFQIAEYTPADTVPIFHRYRVGRFDKPIYALCKRRHMDAVAESDPVFPGDLNALRLECQSINSQTAIDYAAGAAGSAAAADFLNGVTKAVRGRSRPAVQWEPWGPRTPNIRWVH